MPSISATLGYNFITAFVWLACILIHTPMRFKLAKSIYKSYEKSFSIFFDSDDLKKKDTDEYGSLKLLVYCAYQLNKAEIIGLLILSIFTSNGNYGKIFSIFLSFNKLWKNFMKRNLKRKFSR